ncbi:MAG: hypothetical protein LUP96_08115, partial [Methylococcaceae bacterium]|nr:hypothetical protein [Methylococcaceae bacterium]
MNTHIIREQHLHVEVINGTEFDAQVLQNKLSGWCHDGLLPALEKVFNRFAASETWSIDCLDIDAGVLSLEHWEQDLAELVTQAVEKKLREQALDTPSSTVTARTNNVQYKTNQQSLTEALVYFLKTGRL